MATPADTPPSSADEKPQNPASQVLQPLDGDGNDTKLEGVKETSPTSVFVNSEPIREDQIQNAMKFLSHPKVRGSPVMYRRSFLERKGLTKEEIDEAFRRVPVTLLDPSPDDPSPAVTTTQPVVSNQDGQIQSMPNGQQQRPEQVLQPTPVGPISKMGIISQFHWYHAILAVGFLAASGAGTAVLLKKTIVPRLKSWIRKVVSEGDEEAVNKENSAKPSIAEEAAAAAKSAAAAAADVARASQEMLVTKTEEKRFFEELMNMLSVQAHEMKSMSNTIQKLEAGQSRNGRTTMEEQVNQRVSVTNSMQPYANGKADTDSYSARSTSPPVSVEPSAAPHPKSYMDIMEINDAPPNPNQPLSNPRTAPRPKPWESNQTQNSPFTFTAQESTINTSNYIDNQHPNGDDSLPWWQRKSVKISEIETNDEQKFGSSSEEQPAKRSWVPPQPPPVVMPEAAAAIRQPKKSASYLSDDQLLSQSSDVTDELQRITKISELGGPTDANVENSILESESAEIPTEENGSYLET
ncbi:hypothetical protein CASFOL_027858 [Castilleja foliolosa]|uniref:Peroxisomal membrane protein PEX14 n=1 Tax=Castilleja foliolosa TaxID=1961234 RepID=A0ABD3CGY1_9LAMI